jgi:L-asparaginase
MSKPRIHVLALGGTIATRPDARALGVMAVMLDEVYAAADVIKAHPTRLNAFRAAGRPACRAGRRPRGAARPAGGDAVEAARRKLGKAAGVVQPVALLSMGLDEPGHLIEAMLSAPDRLGYRGTVIGAMGGGHVP